MKFSIPRIVMLILAAVAAINRTEAQILPGNNILGEPLGGFAGFNPREGLGRIDSAFDDSFHKPREYSRAARPTISPETDSLHFRDGKLYKGRLLHLNEKPSGEYTSECFADQDGKVSCRSS